MKFLIPFISIINLWRAHGDFISFLGISSGAVEQVRPVRKSSTECFQSRFQAMETPLRHIAKTQDEVLDGNRRVLADDNVEVESASLSNSAISHDDEIFDNLRKKYVLSLTLLDVGSGNDLSNPLIAQEMASIEQAAQKVWNSMIKTPGREEIFLGLNPTNKTDGAAITKTMKLLKSLALALSQPSNKFYQNPRLKNDVMSAFAFVIDQWYNKSTKKKGNWWDWMIGIPLESTDILLLMSDDMTEKEILWYVQIHTRFLGNNYAISQTGANRVHCATIGGRLGILAHQSDFISYATAAVSKDLRYNEKTPNGLNDFSNDGFYRDDSFIQHFFIAYTGSYGKELITYIVSFLFTYLNSPWALSEKEEQFIHEVIDKSFVPLMYDGAIMDMVNGRSIVRANNDRRNGYSVMNTMYKLSLASEENRKIEIQSILKDWMDNDKYFYQSSDPKWRKKIAFSLRSFMKNTTVTPRVKPKLNKPYPLMDRVVHFGKNFAFGLSMFSKRIASYELINGENVAGWYTGSGMTYLYNKDSKHYTDAFWYTVDMYRLPGTTLTKATRDQNPGKASLLSPYDWVGSSSLLNLYGTAGMMIHQVGSDLRGKKSWFMFEDEIVALGVGISSSFPGGIETVIENRMIDDENKTSFAVNGVKIPRQTNFTMFEAHADYAYLDGGEIGSSIGYYFPSGESINVFRNFRTGSSRDVSTKQESEKVFKRNFITMWKNHSSPSEDTYKYVILPSKSRNFVKNYAANPRVEVVINNNDVQAVRNTRLNILGANFWTNKKTTAGIISSYDQASVILKEKKRQIVIAASDPTLVQTKITLEVAREGASVVIPHDRVTVKALSPQILLEIDVKDSKGLSIEVKIALAPTPSDV